MTLSAALYNAFSGLRANTRAAGVVSTNIANATTESYGRRSVALSVSGPGTIGGVNIDGVIRNVDPVLIKDRQQSDASAGFDDVTHSFTTRFETSVGDADDAGSLTNRLVNFENALLTAAANPASSQRLENVAVTADALAVTLNTMSESLQDIRLEADRNIDIQVTAVNEAIARLDEINTDVVRAWPNNGDLASLLDERQRLLDGISPIVPLRVVERDRGEIAVFTTKGAVLLDGRNPAELEFTRSNAVDPYITYDAGFLSGITQNGVVHDPSDAGRLGGGSLSALFEVRDTLAVTRQEQLDGIARDLIERLDDSGPDATLAAGDPGVFTDAGAAFVTTDEVGISARISINTLIAPGSGNEWLVRDGLGAVAQGEVGDASLIQDISSALTTSSVPSSSALTSIAKTFITHVNDFTSDVGAARVRAENDVAFTSNRNTMLRELEFAGGVDTDMELQNLMLIEQHYAANAKMMSTVDELFERLLAI